MVELKKYNIMKINAKENNEEVGIGLINGPKIRKPNFPGYSQPSPIIFGCK